MASLCKLSEIYLLESNFKRAVTIDFNDPSFKNNANISVEHQVLENETLNITVTLDYRRKKKGRKKLPQKLK